MAGLFSRWTWWLLTCVNLLVGDLLLSAVGGLYFYGGGMILLGAIRIYLLGRWFLVVREHRIGVRTAMLFGLSTVGSHCYACVVLMSVCLKSCWQCPVPWVSAFPVKPARYGRVLTIPFLLLRCSVCIIRVSICVVIVLIGQMGVSAPAGMILLLN